MNAAARVRRWVVPSLLVIAGLVALLQSLYYFTRTVDDLFISLRYAAHLADGTGLVYNPGEYVEGFSSPLWVVLQAIGHLAGIDGVTATKVISLASLGLLAVMTFTYSRSVLQTPPTLAAMGCVALAANSYVMAWAWLGLETPLYLALLVAWPLTLHHLVARPSVARGALATATGCALGTVRPEAPLFVGLLLCSSAAAPSASLFGQRARHLAGVAVVVGLVLSLLLLARHSYFDGWLPHTYYAKRGAGFAIAKLRPLWSMGAHPVEVLLLLVSLVGACWLAVRRRLDALVVLVANGLFVGAVGEDWMPNQRHLLPTWVFSTMASTALVARLWSVGEDEDAWGSSSHRAVRHIATIGSACVLLLLGAAGVHQIGIDSRFSAKEFLTHGRGRNWVRFKTLGAWRDAWLALRRIPTPDIAARSVHRLGMIGQLFRVLENAPDAEDEEWYVGRDIGRLGYLSPVRVFDTDGLFTPAVVAYGFRPGTERVPPSLARQVFALHPLAGEVYEAWPPALAPYLQRDHYEIVVGSPRYPVAFVRRGPKPPAEVVLDRYDRVDAMLPHGYYVSTLYGECVGAAFDKRHAYVRDRFVP